MRDGTTKSPVLWHVRPDVAGRQLFLFPFLGGFGASFNPLVRSLRDGWDIWTVNPPGHGPSREAPIDHLADLVARYIEEFVRVLRPGAVFFGHSMGGIVAYHVISALVRSDRLAPALVPVDLVLSAVSAPGDVPAQSWSRSRDAELIERLIAIDAIPALIAAEPSLLELFLPAFRSDYGVLDDARGRPVEPLDVRTRLILGELDPHTPSGTSDAWQRHLTSPLRTQVLAGEGHMFVRHALEPLDRILADVRDADAPVAVAVDGQRGRG
ncbi:external thioesterase TEII [Clavibacter michiganensis]|uniref:thioesterase II family protein n=1 Tax=Clavibacter michiganensis TaxID=28447 RepID=UPI00195A91E6|nr:alpha/beta fold hydrolase [Clavibacter michiganensis]MBM7411145.1 external thioesterase TEII [Clavibacter michiganensis]